MRAEPARRRARVAAAVRVSIGAGRAPYGAGIVLYGAGFVLYGAGLWLCCAGLAACGGGGGDSAALAPIRLLHDPPIAQLSAEQLRSLSMECEKYPRHDAMRGRYDAAYCEAATAAWADSPLQMLTIPPPRDGRSLGN